MTIHIHISKDFSRFPGGRYKKFGPFSGEEFRDDLLIPRLDDSEADEVVEIDLSEVFTYAPSFLDESFAALVRNGRYSAEQFHAKIKFISDAVNRPYIALINSYVAEADAPNNAIAS